MSLPLFSIRAANRPVSIVQFLAARNRLELEKTADGEWKRRLSPRNQSTSCGALFQQRVIPQRELYTLYF